MTERSTTERPESSPGLRLLRPHASWLLLVVGMLCLLAFVDMAQPWFLALLIDEVFLPTGGREGNWSLLWLILPGMGLIYVSRNTLFYASRMRALRISEDICFDLRKRLFEHLQQLSLRFYRSNQPGRISARLMDDTFRIQSVLQDKLPSFVRFLIELQILLIIIYIVNWRLALAATIVLPLHLWTFRRFRAPIRSSHSETQEHLAAAQGTVVERFLGMEVVKGFSGEQRESASFAKAIDAGRASAIRTQRFQFTQKVVADLLVGLGTVLLLGYGAMEVKSGRMTGGAFIMFFWYVRMLYPALLAVISGAGHLSRASASIDRVTEMLDEPVLERDGVGEAAAAASAVTAAAGSPDDAGLGVCIAFQDVSFSYEEQGHCTLERLDLTIEPGQHVAITGPSGAGKSTLVSLLPRFNDPTGGVIEVNGVATTSWPLRTLRGLFGFVFQDVFLFNTTIDENLRYARPDATQQEVEAACRLTGAHEIIERLPEGYFTRLGGRSGELSRGERQRITLARALVRDPQVLVLDEATASIDPCAAREIIESILARMEDRTVIIVTHDVDLLDLVDRVVTLERGRIVFDGAPEDIEGETLGPRSPRRSPLPRRPTGDGAPAHADRPGRRLPDTLAILLLALLMATGCARTTDEQRTVSLDRPRTNGGIVVDDEAGVDLRAIAEAIDAMELSRWPGAPAVPGARKPAITPAGPGLRDDAARASALASAAPDRLALGTAAGAVPGPSLPDDAVHIIPLPKLSGTEINELIDLLALRLMADHGYGDAAAMLSDAVPLPPDGVAVDRVLARRVDGATRVLQIGHRRFLSQLPQLWLLAVSIAEDGTLAASGDGEPVKAALTSLVASLGAMRENVTLADLDSKLVQLSYIDARSAMKVLQGLGISTLAEADKMPAEVEFAKLPYVIMMPDPDAGDVGLIGKGGERRGEFGVSLTPSIASELSERTVASPMTQLLVTFHPAHPEQFSRVRRLLDDYVDRPARQIFVEGLVLEIAEDGLKDLGIEWELNEGPLFWRFGSPRADGQTDTLEMQFDDLDFWRVFTRNFEMDFTAQIRALVREGKAEVLSRPSVLTLNNRQSTIRVGRDIPIATSQEGTLANSNKIAFSFKYLATGILLNIRPRINEDGDEVSMQIDTIVSDVVPGEDLEIRSVDGDLLASAPTVSTRRVQTYARIRNNTPFIIGGLVARLDTTELDKIPLLGDIPLIGGLFRAERSSTTKREVIIVLTPYVLPEHATAQRSLPKDDDLFDSFGHKLFRDSYRIRAEDVFDLGFLQDNERLTGYRALAADVIAANYRLGEEEPFRSFTAGSIPGEGILVTRMIYEVAKRLEVSDQVPAERMIFFERERNGGYDVQFIEQSLSALAGGGSPRSFFSRQKGKALVLTWDHEGDGVPALSLADCPDRAAWGALLWELNQPDTRGYGQTSIVIQSEDDLERLRRAIAIKRIIDLNGGDDELLLRTFNVGKVLLMPELKPEQVHLVDAEVARIFFQTEHYYAATLRTIEEQLGALDAALERPDVKVLLEPGAK